MKKIKHVYKNIKIKGICLFFFYFIYVLYCSLNIALYVQQWKFKMPRKIIK